MREEILVFSKAPLYVFYIMNINCLINIGRKKFYNIENNNMAVLLGNILYILNKNNSI